MQLKISLLLTFLLLSACGWQLRGVTPLPPEYRVLYLQSQASANFNRQLKLQLEFNKVLLTKEAVDAQATLTISPLEIERRTLSLTSNGQIAEFELNGLLTATLKRNDRDSDVTITLKGRRHLRNDINNVTGTANAEKQLLVDLEKDLVSKLLMRLQHLDYDQENPPTKTETKQ